MAEASAHLREIFEKLVAERAWVVTVESCTGGGVATALTELPGASAFFWGSYVTYANEAKLALGVSADALFAHGAVSEPVARAMAEAGLRAMTASLGARADQRPLYSLAITGIAGPDSPQSSKPVGLCYLACATRDGVVVRKITEDPNADRTSLRVCFLRAALELLHG